MRMGRGCSSDWLRLSPSGRSIVPDQPTPQRRGDICGLRWSDVELEHAVLTIRRTVFITEHGELQEKDTKTHQQRRVVLDPQTTAVLRDHHTRAKGHAAAPSVTQHR